MGIEDIIGKTILSVNENGVGSEIVVFKCSDGTSYRMYHYQDCCENVQVDNIEGNVIDLLNAPVIRATETNPDRPVFDDQYIESFTWTDFTISTEKGTVVFQWLGCSNGYYGETPCFEEIKKE